MYQKVTGNGYYGIENLYQTYFEKLRRFWGLLNAARWCQVPLVARVAKY